MTGNLLVKPEELIQASGEFQTNANEVNNLTSRMLELVNGLRSTWAGEANTAYTQKFNSLSDDMNRMYRKINEHSTDLQEMARNYQAAEQKNVATSSGLGSGVFRS